MAPPARRGFRSPSSSTFRRGRRDRLPKPGLSASVWPPRRGERASSSQEARPGRAPTRWSSSAPGRARDARLPGRPPAYQPGGRLLTAVPRPQRQPRPPANEPPLIVHDFGQRALGRAFRRSCARRLAPAAVRPLVTPASAVATVQAPGRLEPGDRGRGGMTTCRTGSRLLAQIPHPARRAPSGVGLVRRLARGIDTKSSRAEAAALCQRPSFRQLALSSSPKIRLGPAAG